MITVYVNTLPADYRWATEYEAETGNLIDAVYVRTDYGQVDIAVPNNHPTPCQREFGEHGCTGDEDCPGMDIVYNMNAPYPSDYLSYDYSSYDPQTDHYERFGYPAFPNEY